MDREPFTYFVRPHPKRGVIFKAIFAIFVAALVSCSKSHKVQWVPKDGLAVVTAKDAKTVFSSKEIQGAHIVVEADGARKIWFEVRPPEAFFRYVEHPDAEPLKLQINGVTIATFTKEFFASGAAFPVPDTRNSDGSWLSSTILNRVEESVMP